MVEIRRFLCQHLDNIQPAVRKSILCIYNVTLYELNVDLI